MRVLHLVTDWWLTDCAVDVFESQPFENRFVIFRGKGNADFELKVAKRKDAVQIVEVDSAAYRELLRPGRWDLVWVHGLYADKAVFCCQLEKRVKIMWTTWGIDYSRFQVQWRYGRKTLWWVWRNYKTIKGIVIQLALWCVARMGLSRFLPSVYSHFARRVDYMTSVVPTEEPLMRVVVGKRPKWLPFHCTYRQAKASEPLVVDLDSKNMLVGHAAYSDCNHFDLFPLLAGIQDYDIWSPLSYSAEFGVGPCAYADAVVQQGMRLFGKRFHPMMERIPFEDYRKFLARCSVYVFGNKRQLAMGNISMALRSGGCVFMDPANPIYSFFVQQGVLVYPISRLKDGVDVVLEEFRPHQQENIAAMKQCRSHDRLIAEIDSTIQYLIEHVHDE